jgi:3-deoxy-D-manno-octulosonic-acid transferase
MVKFDIWPNLVWEAKSRKIKTALISATLHRGSKRYSNFLGQFFYSSIYMSFDFIGAVSNNDVQRFFITAPKHKNIKLCGDTRFEQVSFRSQQRTDVPMFIEQFDKHFTIICGSIWPADEKEILKPLKRILKENPETKLILVPHEPHTEHVEKLKNFFKTFGTDDYLNATTINKFEGRVLIINTVGILAELYRRGTLAYVGGAFTTGVHNIMEPAIMGLPVLFGPFFYNAPEAERLVEKNLCFSATNSDNFYYHFNKFVKNKELTKKTGSEAKAYIESNMGATEKCYKEIFN